MHSLTVWSSTQWRFESPVLGDDHYNKMDVPCHSGCGTLKNPLCSMTIRAEHSSKYTALRRQWWSLQMCKKNSRVSGTNKQTNQRRFLLARRLCSIFAIAIAQLRFIVTVRCFISARPTGRILHTYIIYLITKTLISPLIS